MKCPAYARHLKLMSFSGDDFRTKADGGARRDRTDDLKLAKLALSQLSYGPVVQPLGRVRSRTHDDTGAREKWWA